MSDATPTPEEPPVPPQQPQYQQPAPPPPQYAAPAQPLSPESDKQAAMWAHIGGVVGFLPSLLIWLILKDRGPRVAVEGKEALNWQITWEIVYAALWIVNVMLTFSGVWVLTLLLGLAMFAIWVLNVIFSIMGGVRVNAGGSYRYPINFRFIK